MLKLINGSPEDIGRGKLAQRNRRRIVCCIKRFACRAQLALLAFIVCVVAPAGRSSLDRKLFTVALAQKPATEKSDAQKSFELMKTLAGNWKGPVTMVPQMPDMNGLTVGVSLRVTSGGTALMHEMGPEGRTADPTNGDDDPITMLYIEGDRLLLTHYCDTWKNRPSYVRQVVAGREDSGIRISRCSRHEARIHEPRGFHLHRREPSHGGLDYHYAGR